MKRRQKSPILRALRNAAIDEDKAVEFMERQRWGDNPACPRCGDVDVYHLNYALRRGPEEG